MNLITARLVSLIFNPLLILVFLPFVLVYESTHNLNVSLFWTGYTFIFLLTIAEVVLYAVSKKIFTDSDVSRREQRPLLFNIFLIAGIVYLAGLYFFHAPRILFIMLVSLMFGILVVSVINTKIKASLHVATIAALILGLVLGLGAYYSLLLLIVPLVAWSRVKLKRHTVSETVIGGIVGSLLLLGIYGFFEVFLNR